MRLKAIVVRNISDEQIEKEQILKNDSVHGSFKGIVDVDLESRRIIVNIKLSSY